MLVTCVGREPSPSRATHDSRTESLLQYFYRVRVCDGGNVRQMTMMVGDCRDAHWLPLSLPACLTHTLQEKRREEEGSAAGVEWPGDSFPAPLTLLEIRVNKG